MENKINKKFLIQNLNSNPGFSIRLFIFFVLFQVFISLAFSLSFYQYSNYQQKLFENEIRNLINKYQAGNFSENKNIVVNWTESLLDDYFDKNRLKKRQHQVNLLQFIFLLLLSNFYICSRKI